MRLRAGASFERGGNVTELVLRYQPEAGIRAPATSGSTACIRCSVFFLSSSFPFLSSV